MKTATVRDLRNSFARVSRWLARGETVHILKHGQPFARLIPEPTHGALLGSMAGTGSVPKDLDEPLGVRWEASR